MTSAFSYVRQPRPHLALICSFLAGVCTTIAPLPRHYGAAKTAQLKPWLMLLVQAASHLTHNERHTRRAP